MTHSHGLDPSITMDTHGSKVQRELKKLAGYLNPIATNTLAEQVRTANESPTETTNPQSGRVEANVEQTGNQTETTETSTTTEVESAAVMIDAYAMIDRFGGDFEDLPDLAMLVRDSDPEALDATPYKDMFENPKTFQEAWNHPDPFQRKKWREAILKEFKKMNDNKVWRKIKRHQMPKNRRCVKHKWIFEIKRDGRFRARLVT